MVRCVREMELIGGRESSIRWLQATMSPIRLSSSPLLASAFYTLPYMGLKWKQNWSPLPTSESNQAQWMLGHFSILPVCDRDGNGLDSSRVEQLHTRQQRGCG
jgi:hypothetical protein